jgi:hypothetical protein
MRPHRLDAFSLTFGLLFFGIALWWAVAQLWTVQLPAAGWLIAGALILFGVIGLNGAIRSGRRTDEAVDVPVPVEPAVGSSDDLPPQMHADIVRELLDDPADRFHREHPTETDPPHRD